MIDHPFILPDVAEGIAEVEIVRWLAEVGDEVVRDAPLVEVETDKSLVEIGAPCDGVLVSRGAEDGQRLAVGEVLAKIATDRPPVDVAIAAAAAVDGAAVPLPRTAGVSSAPSVPGPRPASSPATRRRAMELEVDLSTVRGSGPGGRILLEDVDRAAAGRSSSPAGSEPDAEGVTVVRQSAIRRRIAEAMVASAAVPTIHEWRDIDVSALLDARAAASDRDEAPPGLLAVLVRAVLVAASAQPTMFATFDALSGDLAVRASRDIGIATATDDGLLVPVLRDCEGRSVAEIHRGIEELVARARSGRLSAGDQLPAGLTISNYGSLGTRRGAPMLRPPEVAIVGLGAIHDAVIPTDHGIGVRPIVELAIGTDHRVHDGQHLARFAGAIERALLAPHLLLGPDAPHRIAERILMGEGRSDGRR